MVEVITSILEGKESNLTNGMFYGQQWKIDQIFSYVVP